MIESTIRETNKLYYEAFSIANLQYLTQIVLSSDDTTTTDNTYNLDCRNKLLKGVCNSL